MSWINLHVNRVLPLSISLEERVSRLSLSGYKKGTFIYHSFNKYLGLSGGSDSKESACNAGRPRFNPWVGKIPWRRKWQPTPAFSPGEVHGQRSLAGYRPWDSLGKNTRVGSHSLLQGIFRTQGSNLGLPALQADSLADGLPRETRSRDSSLY